MGTEQGGLQEAYNRRNFDGGPSTYSDKDFLAKIYAAAGLEDMPEGRRVLDFMSGPGKLGLGLKQYFDPTHQYIFFDRSLVQLGKIDNEDLKVAGDARVGYYYGNRHLPFQDDSIDLVVARYAIKDLPQIEQGDTFKELNRIIVPGGRLIVADMVAPDWDTQGWLIGQHSMKQEFSGRNIMEEGTCFIPTENFWLSLFRTAGFDAMVSDTHSSYVNTTEWLRGNQITEEQLYELNRFIAEAPTETKEALNIFVKEKIAGRGKRRRIEREVSLDYPLIIVQGTKKE